MRPWNPNTKSTGLPGIEPRLFRQAVPVGAHCDSAHWTTEAGTVTYICRINLLSNYIAAVSCPVTALTLLVGRQGGHLTCIKLNVGLLMMMIWLQLCTSYSSTCHQSPPLPSSLASTKPANPGLHGKVAVKTEREVAAVSLRDSYLVMALMVKVTESHPVNLGSVIIIISISNYLYESLMVSHRVFCQS